MFFDLLSATGLATTILQHVGDEENVRTIMRHPRALPAVPTRSWSGAKPHPRAWGTFPRYLGHYVRELGVLGLEDCVHHLTGRPAARLGLLDRGLVRVGHAADLVLFDPDTVRDTATYEQPRQQAHGIDWVLVNGVAVIEDGDSDGCAARSSAAAHVRRHPGGPPRRDHYHRCSAQRRGGSSAGQSRGLIIPRSRVRAPPAPPQTVVGRRPPSAAKVNSHPKADSRAEAGR